MVSEEQEIAVNDVVFREDLYPRIKHDPALVQRYAENLDVLPPIEVNQHQILIDGWHRWTAHRKKEAKAIRVRVTETPSEQRLFELAVERNAAHGLQMSEEDKRTTAIRLYAAGTGMEKARIAEVLSVTPRSVNDYLTDVDKKLREDRKQRIFDMWLACHTLEDIGTAVGVAAKTADNQAKEFVNLEELPKLQKVAATFADAEFEAPVYNVWAFAKKSNAVQHFGNSEQRILENLLYLYTEPFDIILDPFAGGGATIDVCRKRLRRYWVSDRKPIVEREGDIRLLDVVQELPPLNRRWSEVTLSYLDPPYWKQAAGKYSQDDADLANMALPAFTEAVSGVVRRIAEKQSHGAIALLVQPTQWSADERQFTDHVLDILGAVKSKRLTLENRVSCPYPTEQYKAQQVEWAKSDRKLLVLTRELIVWRATG